MYRRRAGIALVMAIAFMFLPYAASAAGLVSCGDPSDPGGSTGCQACNIVDLLQNVINFALGLSIPIAISLFAYAGFLYFTSASNTENISKAHKIFRSALMGFIVALLAFTIVNTLLHAVLAPQFSDGWNSIKCVATDQRNTNATIGQLLAETLDKYKGTFTEVSTCPAGTEYSYLDGVVSCYDPHTDSATLLNPSSVGVGDCSASNILNAARTGGYTLSSAQANTLSCLSMPESGCTGSPGTATTPGGTPTTAAGHFQIVLGYNDQCHNLNISACTAAAQAAGYSVSGDLNCSTAFRGGKAKPGMETLAAACKAAAANFTCNTSAAACLVNLNPSFNDWTADPRSNKQRACIAQYNR